MTKKPALLNRMVTVLVQLNYRAESSPAHFFERDFGDPTLGSRKACPTYWTTCSMGMGTHEYIEYSVCLYLYD